MPPYAACLVDVFDTVLSVDSVRYNAALAERAGVEPATFAAAVGRWSRAVTVGEATIETALRATLRECGRVANGDWLSQLVAEERRVLHELAIIHHDAVPFLESLRASGIRTAFVSNCADSTRPLLEDLGLHELVDELVLSCEVGAAKPDPVIYLGALERLHVDAEQALFVDDQQAYCDGAAAVGVRAFRIDRFDDSGEISQLTQLLPHFAG